MLSLVFLLTQSASAFCGTYVASAGGDMYNTSSQVVIGRQGTRTTLTMTSDISGPSVPTALVVPVPPTMSEADFKEIDPELMQRLDSYSAPRLVAYDCDTLSSSASSAPASCDCQEILTQAGETLLEEIGDFALDYVETRANFYIGNTEVFLLDATASGALVDWLEDAGFGVPGPTAALLDEYVQAGSHFLVADMTLDLGGSDDEDDYVTPLQMTYESPALTLPIKLGSANSSGVQHLTVYVIGDGQARITNYEQVKNDGGECMPPDDDFGPFYEDWVDDVLDEGKRDGATWTTEYAWAPVHCDPCSDYPLTQDEVEAFGYGKDAEGAFFTRLHMRFTPAQAKDDLQLQLFDGSNSQVRFIEYLEELESDFPICGEGWAKNPGTCDDGNAATARLVSPSRGRAAGSLIGLLAVGVFLRRRR
jgi:hypothetical protein